MMTRNVIEANPKDEKGARKMKKSMRISMLAVVLATVGCVPTLYSLFTIKDVTYEPQLVGTWKSDKTTWTIMPWDVNTAGIG
jgi:hypothetical protein